MATTFSRPLRLAALFAVAGLLAMPAMAQPTPPQPFALDLREAAGRPALVPGATVTIRLRRGEAAHIRLPEGAGDLVAQTRRLARDIDTVMALVDSQGRVLAEDDDGGDENLASRLDIFGDQAGPLFLRIGLLDQASGSFDLELAAAPPRDPDAPAATLVEAVARPPLELGQGVAVRLGARQEAWFRLPAGGQDLLVVTRNLARGTDTVLVLHDANGREIQDDDDGGDEQLSSRLEIPSGQRRPLFVRARNLSGAGSFEIAVLPDTTPPAPPFPGSLREAAAAPALAIGQSMPLRLRRGQVAFFRLPEGDIAVETRNLRRGADTVLALLDANGEELAEDDDGGGGLASRLEVAARDRRPLFVRARLLGDGGGEFDLVVEADSPVAPTFPASIEAARNAAPLQPGTPVQIRLRRGQVAVFALPAGSFVATTRRLVDGTDTVLELIEADGRVIAEDDDGGDESLASRLVIDSARKGDVYLRASVLGGGRGGFDLVLQPAR